jgi:RsiW-degrading membrane proteinase PrsW (M82 family)
VWTVLAGLFGYVVLLLELLITRNTTVFPALLLVGALTVPLAVLLWAVTGKYSALAPASTVLVTVLVGGLVGIVGAGILESVAGAILGRDMVLLVGFIEESVKLLVPLVVLLVAYRRTVHGGVAIGVAAGAGFAVLETMGYGFNALLGRSGGIGAVDATLLLRGVLAPAGHIAWTGAVCAAIWFLRSGRRPVWGVLATIGAYLAAIVLHTVWDAADSLGARLVVGLVSVAGLLVLVILAHRGAARGVEGPASATPAVSGMPGPWTGQV